MWTLAKSSSTVLKVFYRRGNENMPFERVGLVKSKYTWEDACDEH